MDTGDNRWLKGLLALSQNIAMSADLLHIDTSGQLIATLFPTPHSSKGCEVESQEYGCPA